MGRPRPGNRSRGAPAAGATHAQHRTRPARAGLLGSPAAGSQTAANPGRGNEDGDARRRPGSPARAEQHTRQATPQATPQAMHGQHRHAATAAATGQHRDPARDVRNLDENPFPKTKP